MSSLIGDAFTVLFARSFVRVAQVLAFILLARYLTAEEFGWFGIVTTAIVLSSTLGSLGLRQSVAYRIGRGQLGTGEGVATILFTWPLLAIVSAAVVCLVYGRDLPGLSAVAASCAILTGVAGSMLITMLQGVFLGKGDIPAFSVSEALPRILLAAASVILALASFISIASALWAYALSFALATPIAIRYALGLAGEFRPRWDQLAGLIGYGIAFAFNLFLVTLFYRSSMFVIERYDGAATAGVFFAAIRVTEIILEAATALGLVIFSRATRSENENAILPKAARAACWIFWIFTCMAAPIAIFAPKILNFLLGTGYPGAGAALRIIAIGIGAAAASKVIYPAIAGQGRPLFGTLTLLVSLALNLALAIWLVPHFGIYGAAWALVAGQLSMLIGYIVMCRITLGISVGHFLVPTRSDVGKVIKFVSRNLMISSKE